MSVRLTRHVVFNEGQYPASYSEAICFPGIKQASYHFARENAQRYGGILVAEYSDGSTKRLGSYRRPDDLPQIAVEEAQESV